MGALMTAILYVIGTILLAAYLAKMNLASVYGVAGSMLVVLIWLYFSAHFFIFGTAFTKVYSHKHGSRKAKQ